VAISDTDKQRITKWCEERTPVDHRDKLRVEVVFRGNSADIIDAHAPWHPAMGDQWERLRAAKTAIGQRTVTPGT
jgi:hypothetical protein